MNLLFSAVYDYSTILSPFLILCSYPLLRFVNFLASPYVVAPVAIGGSTFAFWLFGGNSAYGLLFGNHFLIGAVVLLASYSLFLKSYSRMDSLLLSVLIVLAADQLWQLPLDAMNWSVSLYQAELGLTTVAFSLMSVPVLFYLVLKIDGAVKTSRRWLSVGLIATAVEIPFLKPGDSSVWFSPAVMVCWACFLASSVLLSRSKPV